MEGMDLSAYTGVVDDLVSALGTAVPTLLTAAAAVGGGLIAFRIGWRLIRGVAK